jgi:hypothetical protein
MHAKPSTRHAACQYSFLSSQCTPASSSGCAGKRRRATPEVGVEERRGAAALPRNLATWPDLPRRLGLGRPPNWRGKTQGTEPRRRPTGGENGSTGRRVVPPSRGEIPGRDAARSTAPLRAPGKCRARPIRHAFLRRSWAIGSYSQPTDTPGPSSAFPPALGLSFSRSTQVPVKHGAASRCAIPNPWRISPNTRRKAPKSRGSRPQSEEKYRKGAAQAAAKSHPTPGEAPPNWRGTKCPELPPEEHVPGGHDEMYDE